VTSQADSYVTRAAQAAAEFAAPHKLDRYANIDAGYLLEPTAVDTLGVINITDCHLLNDLGNLAT